MSTRAAWLSAAALCSATLGSTLASADDEACRRAYVETQHLQRAAQFLAARREAVVCGQDACSVTVREQCTSWLESIERALPTLVIDARDGAGAALAEVRVDANGALLAERLNGRAIEVDPGEYLLRFRYQEQVIEQRTLIRESEKYRRIEVRFPSPEPPGATLASEPIPTASYVLGGLGVAGLASFVVLASSGYAKERQLRKTCAGACSSDAVASVRTRYVVGDLALGVGLSSLIAAAAVWIWAPSDASTTPGLSLGPDHIAFEGQF